MKVIVQFEKDGDILKKLVIVTSLLLYMLFSIACEAEIAVNESLVIGSDVEYGKEDYTKIIGSNNQLGFHLFNTATKDKDGNVFISPTSIFTALAMVYNGADGKTKEEMSKVLGVEELTLEEVNKANASLMNMLYEKSEGTQLSIGNALWINEKYNLQNNFISSTKDYFNAKTEKVDFTDSKTSDVINDWVKDATNKKIKKIIDVPLAPDLAVILMNVIYFHGSWEQKFDEKETKDDSFYLEEGTVEVPFMELEEDFDYLENDIFQAISLPYRDSEMSMNIFLPKENVSLIELEHKLTNDSWQQWNTAFNRMDGTVLLPKFQMEYKTELNKSLGDLGMASAFEADNANFTKVIRGEQKLTLSTVVHKTFVTIDEEGTEAAAATLVAKDTSSQQSSETFYMKVNRPFFFTIQDNETGIILFMGAINNPKIEN